MTIELHDCLLETDVCSVFIDDGIATLVLSMPGTVNKINAAFGQGLDQALTLLLGDAQGKGRLAGLKGIVVGSAHKDFCVGADLDWLLQARDPADVQQMVAGLNALYRKLETGGVPVVAALTGTALGGGYELALACHHRVALDEPRVQLGLPEVNLGVIPGAGGTQRLSRMLGLQAALELLAQGQILRASKAAQKGLVDELATDLEDLKERAIAWIRANPGAKQPWDGERFRLPGGGPDTDMGRNVLMAGAAMVYNKTAGAFPAAEAIMMVVQEGARVSFDAALQIESRAFVRLAVSDQAKDMIRTFFFHKTAAERHEGLPVIAAEDAQDAGIHKVAVLGAGMMGGGLAFVAANAGYDVVLRDIRQEALDAAMARAREQVGKRLKHRSAEERQAVLDRIHPTLELEPLRGTDLVIEAVVESMKVKHAVIAEVEPLLSADAIWASNTSALPISDLAVASRAPERFIGLHYFSPVEQMPLVEIIQGKETDPRTVARCLVFARQTKKTPIVVNDGYGFYTTRVFSAYILEGAQLVAEGRDPRLVEWGARQAGMVVGPLQVFDEVTLSLGSHVLEDARRYIGDMVDIGGTRLVGAMVEAGRLGRAHGAGFYDYQGGRRQGIWPGLMALAQTIPGDRHAPGADPVAEARFLGRRLLLAQCAEVARRLDEGILQRPRDAEVGAIFGIGFAPNTGGPLAFMDRVGLPELVAELQAMSELYGPRYAPAPVLHRMAEAGERFFEV